MIGIGPPRSDREWAEYASITGQAFLGDAEESGSWIALARAVGIVRLVREEGRVVAGAAAYLVPQYFGGREVPAGAVADVCVVPEQWPPTCWG